MPSPVSEDKWHCNEIFHNNENQYTNPWWKNLRALNTGPVSPNCPLSLPCSLNLGVSVIPLSSSAQWCAQGPLPGLVLSFIYVLSLEHMWIILYATPSIFISVLLVPVQLGQCSIRGLRSIPHFYCLLGVSPGTLLTTQGPMPLAECYLPLSCPQASSGLLCLPISSASSGHLTPSSFLSSIYFV